MKMRAVVQTVSRASVTVDGHTVGAITDGLLVLVVSLFDITRLALSRVVSIGRSP